MRRIKLASPKSGLRAGGRLRPPGGRSASVSLTIVALDAACIDEKYLVSLDLSLAFDTLHPNMVVLRPRETSFVMLPLSFVGMMMKLGVKS